MTNRNTQLKSNSRKYVSHQDMRLSYCVYGSGETAVICFHGHGKDAEDFEFLKQKNRKIISIDLFLHGNSTFSEQRIYKNLITSSDVEKLLEKILDQEKVDRFHWVAYSQGGRFTLALFPRLKNRVLSLNLLAPDGLNDKNFYSWSQRRWWARSLFSRWVKRPNELMRLSRILAKTKVIHPKIVDFLSFYTENEDRLKLAHAAWRSFRELRPDIQKVKTSLNETGIPLQLIIGKYDQIITVKSAEAFLKKLDREHQLVVLPYGHDLFKPEIRNDLNHLLNFESIQ